MAETLKKYKKEYLMIESVVFVMGAVLFFYNFVGNNKWTSLAGGIAFTVMTVFKIGEWYVLQKNRNKAKS